MTGQSQHTNWFEKGINTYPEYEQLHPIAFERFETDEQNHVHQHVIDLLKESDINIQDYLIKSEPMSEHDLMETFGPLFQAEEKSKIFEGKNRMSSWITLCLMRMEQLACFGST